MYSLNDVIDFIKGLKESSCDRLKNNIKSVTIEYDNGGKIELKTEKRLERPKAPENVISKNGYRPSMFAPE